MNLGLRREASNVVHGEDQWLFNKAMDHQAMLLGIDRRHAAVMAFVEQTVRRDDAIEVLKLATCLRKTCIASDPWGYCE